VIGMLAIGAHPPAKANSGCGAREQSSFTFNMKPVTETARGQPVVAVDYGKAYFVTDRRNRW
jgi:hypothetical protein